MQPNAVHVHRARSCAAAAYARSRHWRNRSARRPASVRSLVPTARASSASEEPCARLRRAQPSKRSTSGSASARWSEITKRSQRTTLLGQQVTRGKRGQRRGNRARDDGAPDGCRRRLERRVNPDRGRGHGPGHGPSHGDGAAIAGAPIRRAASTGRPQRRSHKAAAAHRPDLAGHKPAPAARKR